MRTHENPKLAHEAPHRRGKLATPGEPWSKGKTLHCGLCRLRWHEGWAGKIRHRRAALHSATSADSANSVCGPTIGLDTESSRRGWPARSPGRKALDQWIYCGRDSRPDQISKSEGALGCVALSTPSGIRHLRCRAGADTNCQQSSGGMPACFRRCPRGTDGLLYVLHANVALYCKSRLRPARFQASTGLAPCFHRPCPATSGMQQRLLHRPTRWAN